MIIGAKAKVIDESFCMFVTSLLNFIPKQKNFPKEKSGNKVPMKMRTKHLLKFGKLV